MVASVVEADLGVLFHNVKEAKIIHLALQELRHPQPPTPTPIHCDNKKTAVEIAKESIKKQRSRSMDMVYFWNAYQVGRKIFKVQWYPG